MIYKMNKPEDTKNHPFSQMHYHTLNCCFPLPFRNYTLPSFHLHSYLAPHLHPSPILIHFSPPPSLTLDWTSALWSFWSSSAADFVSSLRAAMCRAGRRTLPLVSCSNSRETTELWPCWRAMASGVKPSWRSREETEHIKYLVFRIFYITTHIQVFYTQTYLRCNALVPFIFQQVSHHLQVILLSCHVEWSKAIL